ncbi:MAG: TonB-dependent receptor [Flavobacteriales bacterium]|nr:TonB-dependent receptor [Flavobacteriales bacterium]
MKRIILTLMLLIATINTKAQQIKGRVVEILPTGEESPLPGANVVWDGTNTGTTSIEQGFYVISEPESYPATMVVTFIGYQSYKKEIKEWGNYDIVLESSVKISQVEVKGKVNTTQISTLDPINVQTISTGELEKAACCNLSESFSTNATVDVVFTDAVSGAKQIQMLGLDGVYAQITQENIPLVRGIASSYGISYVPGTWIESIQIIKGSGSVVNGFESLTGQINLEYYKPESAPKLFWNSYVNQEGKLDNNLLLLKQNGDWKSNLFTHISYFDREIDHHGGTTHDHTTHTDHHTGDKFLDDPKVKHVSILNRWQYKGNPNYGMQFIAKALIEERLGGQISSVPIEDRYIVNINNYLYEIFSKFGAIQPNTPGKSAGLQTSFKLHNQTAIFGKNNYEALQESAYLNFIRQTYINNTNNIFKYGFSQYADRYTESFSGNINNPFNNQIRLDLMSGLFSEYTFKSGDFFNITTGIRADYYNNTKKFNYLPRLNMKYNPNEKTAFRLSAGRAFRIANVFAENSSFLASGRTIDLVEDLNPEIAWNYGANLTYCFYLNGREGTINLDAYRTDFENQVVVDIETPSELSFYNLDGASYANSIQADIMYELFDRFDVKAAYKINDVYTTYNGEEKISPLTPKNRALVNMSYATNFDKWMFDLTWNYIGESRVPSYKLDDIFGDFRSEHMSDPFYLINAQVTKKFKDFSVYVGGENLLSYTQENPIIDAANPTSSAFDASLIYAPIMGRMIYTGLRYKIK